MNSPPSISHYLLVAAIGNEGLGHERPSTALADQANAIALEIMHARKPMLEGATDGSRARFTQALS